MEEEQATPARESAALLPLVPRAYLPQLLWSIGYGAMLSVLALAATSIGASTSVAALIVATFGVGTVLCDLPAGRLIARIGEYPASRIATVVIVIGLAGAYLAKSPALLGVAVFLVSGGWGIWNLKVLTHLSRVAPIGVRGRALALVGGVSRIGTVIGPFLLYILASRHGNNAHKAFLIFLIGAFTGYLLISVTRDRSDETAHSGTFDRISVRKIVEGNRREILTAGTGTFGISMLRGSRQALLPLWGVHIGLNFSQITLIITLSSILDVAFFYPAGAISDRYGRKIVAVPCLVLLSLGHIFLPFTHGFGSLFVDSLLLGFGNSLGSGIVMTLGADRAPDFGRASFLAVWRVIGDSGTAAGPLLGSAIVGLATLTAAGWSIGALGLVAAAVVFIFMDDPAMGHLRARPRTT